MTLPRDNTKQEKLVEQCLDVTGLRYGNQVEFGKYTVDFYIDEIKTVVEADGIYGHLKKRDRKRDAELYKLGVEHIIHIKEKTHQKICEELWQALDKLEPLENEKK